MNKKFTKLIAAVALLVFMTPALVGWGQSDYSTTYTSNVTLPSSGTNVSSCSINIGSSSYDGTKLGKSGSGASATITAPIGTKYIHLHVAAWNGKSPGFNYKVGSGTAQSISDITSNSGIANSSPFTWGTGDNDKNPNSTYHYKVITLSSALTAATTITLTSTSERVVFWGVNTEEENTTPTISATPASLTGFTYIVNNGPSAAQTISVSGENLTANLGLSLGASSNYEMSLSESSGYANELELTPTSGAVAATTVYVRLKSGLAVNSSYSGTVTLSSTDATDVTVSLSGSVTNQTYTLTDESGVNGSIAFSASPVEAGTHVVLTPTPASDAYYFVANSWSFFNDALEDVTTSIEFVTGETNTIVMPAYNLHVDATFDAKPTYDVVFDCNGGTSGCPSNMEPVIQGTAITLPAAPTYAGHIFNGWNDGTTTYTAGDSYTVNDDVIFTAQWTAITTGIINFGSASGKTNINSASVTGDDNMGNTWTITTVGTSSFTPNSDYAQVGSSSNPATSITFTTTLASTATIAGFSAKFGGFSGTAGTVTLKVGETTVGSGSLNGTSDVVIENSSAAIGTVLTVTVTSISKGVKCYYISYTPSTDPVISAADVELPYSATAGEIAYTIGNPDGSTLEAAEKTPGYDWIDAVTVVGAENKVTFTTTANAGASREGYITLTYGSVTKDVKVTQAGPTYTVTYAANGGTGEMTDTNSPYEVGAEVTLLANTFTAPEGKLWGGWQVTDALDNDIPVTGGKFTMPASNVTVTAIWRGTATYTLVTSADGLVSGKHYVIASGTDGTVKAMGQQNANNRAAVPTTVTESVLAEVEGIFEFVISGDGTNNWTIYDETNSGYLFAAGGGNYLRNQPTIGSSGQWEISFSGDAAVITTNSGDKIMRYNSGNNIFSCYASGQAAIYLYMKYDDKDYNFYSNTTLASATIAADETYTVHSGATLNVTTLTNSGDKTNLVIKDGGQLKTANGVACQVEKNITGYGTSTNGNYYLIAPPYTIGSGDFLDGGTLAPADIDLYFFNEGADKEWINFKQNGWETAVVRAKGYLYARKTDGVLLMGGSISGTCQPTNTTVDVNLDYTTGKRLAGYNLIGNPFTCTAYLTDGRDFLRMNDAGDGFISGTGAINVGEGVFVEATTSGTSVTFTTTAPDSSVGPDNSMITLNLTQNRGAVIDNARIRFDNGNNMTKFMLNEASTKLYIPQNGKDYAVVRSEAQGEMPVNFKADRNGSYTLSIDIDADMDYLHLIDNMTGADVDLLQTPSYTFDARTSDYASRFRLMFSINNVPENEDSHSTFAYFNGSEWVINASNNATVQVVDVMGRVILNADAKHGVSTANMPAGIYMLRLVNGNNVKVQKIVVR